MQKELGKERQQQRRRRPDPVLGQGPVHDRGDPEAGRPVSPARALDLARDLWPRDCQGRARAHAVWRAEKVLGRQAPCVCARRPALPDRWRPRHGQEPDAHVRVGTGPQRRVRVRQQRHLCRPDGDAAQGQDTGDQTLEAGALVLADQGVCCIDEFDKLGADHDALLEAMEQQSISIAKAGVCCTLPTRASVIAAANPVGGHFKYRHPFFFFPWFIYTNANCSKAKTVSENLKLGSALLSRFDLIFILMDRPDQRMDQFLSEHVMAVTLHRRLAPIFINTEISCTRTESRPLPIHSIG